MALPATKVLVAQKDTTNADLTIKATGYQWKWGYDYLNGEGEGLAFISTWTAAIAPCRTAVMCPKPRRLPAQGRQPDGCACG